MGVGVFRALVGALGGLRFADPQSVLRFSSVRHLGWVIVVCAYSPFIAGNYFLVYGLTLIVLTIVLKLGIPHPKVQGATRLLFLALAGLPPFPVFVIKATAISLILKTTTFIVVAALSVSSLVSLGYYVKLLLTSYYVSPTQLYGAYPVWRVVVFGMGVRFGLVSVFR